jgi:hypothetical protein
LAAKLIARGSGKAARAQERTARGPEKAARGQRRTARGPEKAAREQKKAAQNPEKAARGEKAVARAAERQTVVAVMSVPCRSQVKGSGCRITELRPEGLEPSRRRTG